MLHFCNFLIAEETKTIKLMENAQDTQATLWTEDHFQAKVLLFMHAVQMQ